MTKSNKEETVKRLIESDFYDEQPQSLFIRTLCQNITRVIDSKSVTMDRISKETGIGIATLSRIVNQKENIGMSVTTLYRIAKALNVEPSQLLPDINISDAKNTTEIFDMLIRDLDENQRTILLDQISCWIRAMRQIIKNNAEK